MLRAINNFFKRKRPNSNISISESSSDGLNETFLFDFKNYESGYRGSNGGTVVSGSFFIDNSNGITDVETKSKETKKTKITAKPIDILEELETIPTPWNLNNLEDKIEILEYKRDLITQKYSRREVEAMIERLENRKKWSKFKKFFDGYQNTTDEKIDALLEKYDVVMKTSDLFVPEFPDVAIQTMKSYTDNMMKLCKKKPVFYVIAEPDKFRKAYEKRDPILLVQSPFGFYWQILGAWDKEMMLLSEL